MPAKHAKPKIVTNIATGSPWRKKILFTNMLTKDRHKKGRQKWHKHGRQTYMKKITKNFLWQKVKKYILHKNVRTQNTWRAFTAVF